METGTGAGAGAVPRGAGPSMCGRSNGGHLGTIAKSQAAYGNTTKRMDVIVTCYMCR